MSGDRRGGWWEDLAVLVGLGLVLAAAWTTDQRLGLVVTGLVLLRTGARR